MVNIEQHHSEISAANGEERITKLMAANNSFVSIERTLLQLSSDNHLYQKLKDSTERILAEYENEVKQLTGEASRFLRNLDDRKHDEDAVKRIIEAFPDALTHQNRRHGLPVQEVMRGSIHGFSFVPLLVTEGIRLKLFSEEEKGGLAPNDNPNTLVHIVSEYLSSNGSEQLVESLGIDYDKYEERLTNENDVEFRDLVRESNIAHDEKITKVLQKLFELKIFDRNDVIYYSMLRYFISPKDNHFNKRCEFVVNLCPESLAQKEYLDELPIQTNARLENVDGFRAVFEAGLKFYPRKLGFLFHRFPFTNERTIDIAMINEKMEFSLKDIFEWIHEALPPSEEHPILHDVIRLAPKYFSLFWKYYPDAIYLRDEKGRLPLHIALQRAGKWSQPLLSLIAINDPIDRHEKDPVNGLYPFMSAASGIGSDLNVIYYMLRRDPNTWEGFSASS